MFEWMGRNISRRSATRMMIVGVAIFLLALVAIGSEVVGAICLDGWESESGNQGRCSNHGGVDEDIRDSTFLGIRTPWIGLIRWPLVVLGISGALMGFTGVVASVAPRAKRISAVIRTERLMARHAHDAPRPNSPLVGGFIEFRTTVRATDAGYEVEAVPPSGRTVHAHHRNTMAEDRGIGALRQLLDRPSNRRFGSRRQKAVEAFGSELFGSIFVDEVEAAYRQAIDFIRDHDCHLRICLEVDRRFADIPWEYLFDPVRGAFLALSRETTFVRVATTTHQTRSQTPIEQVRILVMSASPRGLAALDVEDEQARIRTELAGSTQRGDVRLEFVDGSTQESLRRALDAFEPHIFHFIGHGTWDEERDDGVVMLEDDAGYQAPVTGRALGTLLNGTEVRLAIFNSCDAGRSSKVDRFAGIAESLVAQGVPAALGMQFRFDDDAATAFGPTLLGALAAGDPVDESVTKARLAVSTSPGSVAWGTPVLTARTGIDHVMPRLSP